MEIKVATTNDLEKIVKFQRQLLLDSGTPEMEITMKSWNEPWREESLRHYLNTGWCFIAWADGEIRGYILCQPLLFFQTWTQSLWVEFVSGANQEVERELLEVAWRWAKSKHLQKVFFNKDFINNQMLQAEFEKLESVEHFQLASTKAK